MNSHEHCAALLDAFIDGALSEQEAERVRAHLAVCAECQAYVSDALAMRDMFPGIEETVVPDGFAESVLAKLPPQRKLWRTRWTKIAVPLAACLTLVLLARGISDGLPANGGASGAAPRTFTAMDAGGGLTEYAVTPDMDMDMDMDGVVMESVTPADADTAFESDTDGGAYDDEAPETEESGVFHAKKAAPEEESAPEESAEVTAELFDASEARSGQASSSAETPLTGAPYDYANAAPSQSATGDAMPPQTTEGDAMPPRNAEGDTMPPQSAENGNRANAAPRPEPDERQRVSVTSAAETESVAVSFWTLPPDAASLLESYAPVTETESGAWYAFTPEQFDALRESLSESALTPMDADTLSDNPPPLRDRAPVYLFLPRSN